jgi:4-hydroxy-tetrahydrodipicolinate synthase
MNVEQVKQWMRGPMVAVATPFRDDLALDLDALRDNVEFMITHGVRNGQGVLLVGGAGGEHPVMNVEERKRVLKTAIDAARGRVPVATSVQHTDTRVMIELARYAAEVGCAAVQVSATYYYEPNEYDIYRLFELMSKSANVPIMIYNTWWAGFHLKPHMLERIAQMDNVVSLKWSAPSYWEYTEGLAAMADKLAVIDNELNRVWSHLLGATGFITHVSNFWPEYSLEIFQMLEAHDYVGAKEKEAAFKWDWIKFRRDAARVSGGEGPFIKAAMIAVGLRAGPPRPPSAPIPEETIASLRLMFREKGVPMAEQRREPA